MKRPGLATAQKVGSLPSVFRARVLVMVAVALATAGAGACTSILSLGDYEIGKDATSCLEPTGFGGRGCFACDASTHEELINACTKARCFSFDESRVPKTDAVGALPDVASDVAIAPETAVTDSGADGDADGASGELACEAYGKPIYVVGSSAMVGLLDAVGKLLGDSRVLVYWRAPSCQGVTSIFSADPQLTGSVPVFGHSKTKSCRITGTASAHIGISDVAFEKCPGLTQPFEIEDFKGPIQVFMFAAPAASTETSISAAAARRLYTLGANSDVVPWTDGRFVMMRHPGSGTQITLGSFIGLDASSWKGNSFNGSTELADACATVPADARNKTICITSADQKDIAFKKSLKTLAFQAPGQACGFFPDSDENSFDKRNVRDGHYILWAPVHFFARVDESSRQPKDADVREAMNWFTGQTLPADPSGMFEALKKAGLVPACAMQVQRDRNDDFGVLKRELPPAPCGCAFENATPGSALDCRKCDKATPCDGSQACRFGFCELK